jgi:hypothetical protein
MTYLRYVITELILPAPQPKTSTQTQKPQQKNTQKPPVPQAKESKVRESFDIRDRDVEARASFDPRFD